MGDFLTQMKSLDPRDPGNWPVLPKILMLSAIFISIVGLGYVFDAQSKWDELTTAEEQETVLKKEYVDKKRIAVNIELYRKRLRDIDVSFGTLLRQLPDKSQVDRLVIDINQAGLARGLQFDLFKPALNEDKKDFYAQLPIDITVVGDYHKLGAFSADIAQLSRIVTLNDLTITTGKDSLVMNATAKTFRYLNDDEIREQKKIAAAKKAAEAPKKEAPAPAEKH